MTSSQFGVIGVVMGGPSAERDISLKSGAAVVKALASQGHRAVPIVLEPGETHPDRVLARLRGAQCDVVFVALHGTFGEDGRIQDIVERCRLPYTGSGPAASRLAFDKWRCRQPLQACGVAIPWAVRLTRRDAAEFQPELPRLRRRVWDRPCIVKPVHQGSSVGISLVTSPEQLASAMDLALQHDEEILLESYVAGRELTVAIFDEQALPVVEIRTKQPFFNFIAKYQDASTTYHVPAALDEHVALQVQRMALAAHRALGCRHVSRVDLILSERGAPVVLEVNTIPGLTERSLLPMAAQACGCSFPALCEHLIAMALESHVMTSLSPACAVSGAAGRPAAIA